MNENDRKFLGRIEAIVERIDKDIQEIKSDISYLREGHEKQGEQIATLTTQMKNHLMHHQRDLKIFLSGIGLVSTVLGIVITLVRLGLL